jgi:uncharacterized protein (TIGR03437 family)
MKIRGLFPIPLFAVAALVWGQDEFAMDNSANFTSVPTIPYFFLSAPGLTPGSLLTLFGWDLSNVHGVSAADASAPLPTQLAGTTVTINDVPAPLLAVANVNGLEQINLQVPYDLPEPMPDLSCLAIVGLEEVCPGSLALRVNSKGVGSRYVVVAGRLEAHAEIFTLEGGTAIAGHTARAGLVAAADPAAPGEVVAIYATGLGPLNGALPPGVPAPASPLIETRNRPTVTVGGLVADVLFSGLAPGLVGVNEIDMRVPPDAPSGDLAVVIRVGKEISKPAMLRVDTALPPEILSAIGNP